MPDLPTGTVTFLFTDIEGSTRLWEREPERMSLALARHDALLQTTIETQGGVVFKTIGDAFCAAFDIAAAAVATALNAQITLHAMARADEGLPLRVRMVLHTGTVEAHHGDYYGPVINRLTRLLSIGHGGQILLSEVTQGLVHDSLPTGASLKNLGTHLLRDLNRPEYVYQLLHPDLPAEFPKLYSLNSLPNNLPHQVTSFVGREKEIAQIKALFADTRLLTLTGPGGAGKTRLSLQIAADLVDADSDGVWLVELAPLSDPNLVPRTVASVLNVREQPDQPILETLIDHLKSQRLLLVLDNCEHLLSACAQLAETLLRACPDVRILASSREALGVGGETTYRVPSLTLPDLRQQPSSVDRLRGFEAIQLFVDRATAAVPAFVLTPSNAPTITRICAQLDGIPLAIELAAARVRSLTVDQIVTRLDDRFRLLTGGSRTALPRQQTLRALIDWSHDLLNAQERILFRRLSIFVGGWTLEAAEQVCAEAGKREEGKGKRDTDPFFPSSLLSLPLIEVLDILTSLVDKSLVMYDEQGPMPRYRLLETMRQYAREKLREAGEEERLQIRHRDYMRALAQTAAPHLAGPDQAHWLDSLQADQDNLRAALDFSLAAASEGVDDGLENAGIALAAALGPFWEIRGYFGEGRAYLAAILARPDTPAPTKARAEALIGAGNLARTQGDFLQARDYYRASLEIERARDDKPGIAAALIGLGNVEVYRGDFAAARALFAEPLALYRALSDRSGEADTLTRLGIAAAAQNDYPAAYAYFTDSIEIKRVQGDRRAVAISLHNLGKVVREMGDFDTARAHHLESLAIERELGDKQGIAFLLEAFADLARLQGQPERAARLYAAMQSLRAEIGSPLAAHLQRNLEQSLTLVRDALGEPTFAALTAEGRAMSMDEAIDYLLDTPSL